MCEISPEIFIDTMLPYVRTAGAYALAIQKSVSVRPNKDGETNPFSQALTDADLSIQTMLEVATLAHFPQVAFYGEEAAASCHGKYFLQNAPYRILLDPIDGTRFYQDGRDNFNIILALSSAVGYEAAIVAIPGRKRLIFFDRQRGVFEEKAGVRQEYKLAGGNNVLITVNLAKYRAQLQPHFKVIDIAKEYSRDPLCPSVNAVLLGEADCFLGERGAAIDWGVLAAVVAAAGGVVSDFKGGALNLDFDTPAFVFPSIVAAVNEAVHQKVLSALE